MTIAEIQKMEAVAAEGRVTMRAEAIAIIAEKLVELKGLGFTFSFTEDATPQAPGPLPTIRQRRRCSICRATGHYAQRCPQKLETPATRVMDDLEAKLQAAVQQSVEAAA